MMREIKQLSHTQAFQAGLVKCEIMSYLSEEQTNIKYYQMSECEDGVRCPMIVGGLEFTSAL